MLIVMNLPVGKTAEIMHPRAPIMHVIERVHLRPILIKKTPIIISNDEDKCQGERKKPRLHSLFDDSGRNFSHHQTIKHKNLLTEL